MLIDLMFVLIVLASSWAISRRLLIIHGVRRKYVAIGFALFILANIAILNFAISVTDDWIRQAQEKESLNSNDVSSIDEVIQEYYKKYRDMHEQLHPR